MSVEEFRASLKVLDEYVKTAAGSIMSKLDRMTYGMLVNCLKSDDPAAVKNAIEQLVKEKRPQAIPPLYLVAVAHPIPWVRQQATTGLHSLISREELDKVTAERDIGGSVRTLIEKYGHYKG